MLNRFHIGKWSTSTVGLEYRDEKGVAQGSTPFEADSDTKSVFFEQQLRFFERLFMSAGFRIEDNNRYGTNTTERGSLAYVIRAWASDSWLRTPADLTVTVAGNATSPGL